jgi:dTDP-glucose pyrophosphorylase/CBS domain-containing protein
MAKIEKFLVAPGDSIRETIACIDRNGKGIALVADEERRLIGTVTDGDIRRAILAGIDLSIPVTELIKRKANSPYSHPITAKVNTSEADLLSLMQQRVIRHIPLLDDDGRLVDLVTLEDLVPTDTIPITATIMAGGYGTRLKPFTDEIPKPMLPIGGRPIMEWIIEGLRQAGIRNIIVTTHYKAESIVKHFGDGRNFGVQIEYIYEEQRSGTAGALALLPSWHHSLLVVNGDILTTVDYKAMLRYHEKHEACMTVAVREYHLQVPYGTVKMEDFKILGLIEKPSLRFLVNAGIYLLEPLVRSYMPQNKFMDMTELIERLLAEGQSVAGFPVREYWIDIGQHAEYEQAEEDARNRRLDK